MKIPQSIIDRTEWALMGLYDGLYDPEESVKYNRDQATKHIQNYRKAKKDVAERKRLNEEFSSFLEWAKKYNESVDLLNEMD